MRTTARTSVHGRHDAEREWRRIVDFAWHHGLAALPAARPEFAGRETRRAQPPSAQPA
jgi:hypothetical protein